MIGIKVRDIFQKILNLIFSKIFIHKKQTRDGIINKTNKPIKIGVPTKKLLVVIRRRLIEIKPKPNSIVPNTNVIQRGISCDI